MSTAFDTYEDCSSKAAALKAAGYETVIRYYSVNSWKRLSAREAQALSGAGLKIAVVYQDRQNQKDDFSAVKGRLAGQNAFEYAQTVIMQPTGSGIYFSADFDPPSADVNACIAPFFQGVRDAMMQANGGTMPYRIGIYGSGLTCRMLLDAGLVELAWLSQSKGFQEYDAFLKSGRWHLSQQMPDTIQGMDCDPDDTSPVLADCGSFTLAADHFGPALPEEASSSYVVNASTGLRLRGGPGSDFDILGVLPFGTPVTMIAQSGDWAQISTGNTGAADGYVFASFLKAA